MLAAFLLLETRELTASMLAGYTAEMVRWYHAIFTAYGFWLPNDPRGSWSDFVASWELYKFGGDATKTNERRSLAHDSHDHTFRQQAKFHLKYPPVRFDEIHRHCIAEGIAKACSESTIGLLALAIGHDHIHAITERHSKTIEQIVGQFKGRATQQFRQQDCHPVQRFASKGEAPASPWAEGCWAVYINGESQLRNAIDYVERHPQKEGLAPTALGFRQKVLLTRLAGEHARRSLPLINANQKPNAASMLAG